MKTKITLTLWGICMILPLLEDSPQDIASHWR